MRKILVFSLFVFLCGCSALNQMNNVSNTIINRENLQGMTQEKVRETYGNPRHTNTSYMMNIRYDYWDYVYFDMLKGEMRMHITFKNGVVTNVSYY